MIESMKIREGLVFTLPIEPSMVVHVNDRLEVYVYNIGEKRYSLANICPIRLKVIKVGRAIVECNIIPDDYNLVYRKNIPIQFEEIAKNGTIVTEEKEAKISQCGELFWLKEVRKAHQQHRIFYVP